VAQLATFSQWEATLGMQTTVEQANASDLVGKYVIIQSDSANDAGYVDYVQFEDGEQYLYVNGSRYSADDLYQVADAEYMEAVTLASAFETTVDNLPDVDDLTIGDSDAVTSAASVYSALSSYQQSYIDNDTLTKFNNVVNRMVELQEAYNKKTQEVAAASEASSSDDATDDTEADATVA
jgi:flagellar basal-body rod modification protein FlgD